MQSKGLDDDQSVALAREIRNLAILLANEHQMHEEAKKLSSIMSTFFKELPIFADVISQDQQILENILTNKTNALKADEEWAREISLDIEFGKIFKDRLHIGPDGITFNDVSFPLEKITRVRWGALVTYVNGVKNNTSYRVNIGTDERMISIECSLALERDATSLERFSLVIDKVWRAVGFRLFTETLSRLSRGDRICYGDIFVDRDGILLQKKKFFLSSEPFYAKWEDLRIGSQDGNFIISTPKEKNATARLSYRELDNVHVLQAMMEFLWKEGNYQKLRRGEFS